MLWLALTAGCALMATGLVLYAAWLCLTRLDDDCDGELCNCGRRIG